MNQMKQKIEELQNKNQISFDYNNNIENKIIDDLTVYFFIFF